MSGKPIEDSVRAIMDVLFRVYMDHDDFKVTSTLLHDMAVAVSTTIAAQQQGQAVAWPTEAKQARSGDWEARTSLCAHTMSEAQARVWNACLAACKTANTAPPPSVPVVVEGLVAKWREEVGSREGGPTAASVHECADELEAALAQQPAAADGAWLSKARSLYDRCSVYPETKPDGMIALLELRNHVYSILAAQHQEPTT